MGVSKSGAGTHMPTLSTLVSSPCFAPAFFLEENAGGFFSDLAGTGFANPVKQEPAKKIIVFASNIPLAIKN